MNRRIPKILWVTFSISMAVLFSSCASDGYPTYADSVPVPELLPTEVVEIQMVSLQENREDDDGIEVAYRFASPQNRRAVGSREDFAVMLRNGGYDSMLNSRTFDIIEIEANRNTAYVAVRIEGAGGDVSGFVFILGRQVGGEFDRCWMTEGVLEVPLPFDGSPPALEPPSATS